MFLRARSVRLRVALLVMVPLLFLLSFFGYFVSTSVTSALALTRSQATVEQLGGPVTELQQSLSRERAEAIVYYARPTPAGLAVLERLQAATDQARAALKTAAGSASVQQGASPTGKRAIGALLASLAQLPDLRAGIPTRSVSQSRIFASYNRMIAASYQVLEQAIIQDGDSSQVLPGIAVIELAVSGEYVQQESALLNGDFAAGDFPASDRQTFVSLVGAHRLLYTQSLQYLSAPDRAYLQRDASPATTRALTLLEDRAAARVPPKQAPAVGRGRWNATVAAFGAQTRHVVQQSLARLQAAARSQADAKLRVLYITGALGLAAVIMSLAVSAWIAATLTRELAGLRDAALELADVHLPGVVRRLRSGEDVDVDAEVPPLAVEPDEIGQVKAAFNAARRTAVEAAVDEAKVRRGISDVFRSLAWRSQSLLHRQMALLDVLERRENDPDNLESLFRIDQLTTRMRRHAESLIVLAGDSPKRAWRNPVPFIDVLRAAAGEVEDYTRIKVTTTAHAALAGRAVADVIHLIAELAENATAFSPATTEVRVTGDLVGTGFAIEIEDRGLGLSEAELASLNRRLAEPPTFDLSGSDQLGIFVTAHLAKRHGIQVSLGRSRFGGVTAIALIPQGLVVTTGATDADAEDDGPHRVKRLRPAPIERQASAAEPVGVAGSGSAETGLRSAGRSRPAAVSPGGPGSPDGQSRWTTDVVVSPSAGGKAQDRFIADCGTAGIHPGQALVADPRPGQAPGSRIHPGAAGHRLPQRVRQANLVPQLRSTPAPATPTGDASREPEAARRVMSAFQRGWRCGIADDGTPDPTGLAEEGGEDR